MFPFGLLISGMIFFSTAVAAGTIKRLGLHPFVLMNILFGLECITICFPSLGSPGRLHLAFQFYILLIAVGVAVITLLLKTGSSDGGVYKTYRFKFSVTFMSLGLTAVAVGCSFLNYRRLGTFPLILMGESTREVYYLTEEVFMPFFTFLGWGCGRTLAVLLALALVFEGGSLGALIARYKILILCTVGVLALNALDGMRNTIFLAAFIILAAWMLVRRISPFAWAAFLGIGIVTFVVVGNLRLGAFQFQSDVNITNNEFVNSAFIWFITYVEPNLVNLHEMLMYGSPEGRGLSIISSIVPDAIVAQFVEVPIPPIQYMKEGGLIMYPGLTFRTMFSDLYYDFGTVGSLIAGFLLLSIPLIAYNKRTDAPAWLLVYLMFVPGVLYAPVTNFFVFLYNLLPIILIFVIGTEKRADPPKGSAMRNVSAPGFLRGVQASRRGAGRL